VAGEAPVESEKLRFAVGSDEVSALLDVPKKARAAYVLAHGAGAGMAHPFLAKVASGLAGRGIATFRYQFPYMEKKSRRPDSPKVAEAAVRAAVIEAGKRLPKLPLIAGGKSFGGRMTSQAEASEPLPGVVGLAFLGFPLHAPGKPSDDRAAHLAAIKVPMLFLQGTRDDFAELSLLKPLVKRLGQRATLHLVEDGDHSFHVRKASGRDDAAVMEELLDTLSGWIDRRIGKEA
jgi:predicted alpha/beta-hydrolase family hydrolase